VEFRRPCAICSCSNRRQPFAPHPAAVAENGLAALARIAAQKPVLAFSPDFRWLILSFHKSVNLADLSVRVQGTILPGNRSAADYQRKPTCQHEITPPHLRQQGGNRVHFDTATIWSAPAERSGDGALAPRACLATLKAVSRSACHRTPYIPHTTNWVVVARCTRGNRP
jgi:hypothetical protein